MKCLVLRKGNIVFGLVLFLLAICIGCAGETKATKKDPFFEKWSTMAEASQGHSPGAEPKKID